MKLRIAYITADRGVTVRGSSGSSIHARQMAGALVARGNSVTVLSGGSGDQDSASSPSFPVLGIATDPLLHALRERMAKTMRRDEREPVRASELYSLMLNQSLAEALSRDTTGFDAVYERQSLWSYAGLQLARRAGIPFVLEVNAPLLGQQSDYRDLDLGDLAAAIEGMVLSSADLVLVTSPSLVAYAQAAGASRRRIRVVPCGVAGDRFSTKRLGTRGASDFVLGFVGSLKPWHGVQHLLDAFLRLAQADACYRLMIIGSGPLLPYVEQFCAEHHLADRVTLVGAVPHDAVPGYLAQCDVGLAPYPPDREFYFSPLKIWEYAAAGVPIVASATGDLPELFPHREAALLHPPGRAGKIAKHVELLRQDPALAERLARRARRVARSHTWDRLAARVESLIAGAIAHSDDVAVEKESLS